MASPPTKTVVPSAWHELRRLTQARIALGRTGTSLPTAAHLAFQFDHARARDAVHHAFDRTALAQALRIEGVETIEVQSAAASRSLYLQRPDLGRRLDPESRQALQTRAAEGPETYDICIAVVDGLSAFAVETNAMPLLRALLPRLRERGLRIAPLILASQGRVALGDEIGALLRADLALVLIGERPGLSSPDSLGIYLTFAPRVGRTDAERNCISNIRPEGLSYDAAVNKLMYLVREARRRGLSGVSLKDETQSDGVCPPIEGTAEALQISSEASRGPP
jgi:ethanolamine ammonia-lyase small subunit